MNQKLAFVFPGQGSQQIGMLADLGDQYAIVKETFDRASGVLGYDLWELTQNGPQADLNRTDKTQPALLTAGVALWRLWQQQGGAAPSVLAGHSLGEYTALVCADVLTLEDAALLVKARGEFMQQAVPAGEGGMAAILGLADEAVEEACKQAAEGEVVAAVNYNSPGQIVIAGQAAAVARAIALCKASGAKRAMELPVSVPSHCALMRPAAEQLGLELEKLDLREPKIPVIQNVSATFPADLEQLKNNLQAQLYSPVLWTTTVQRMAEQGVETIIECGPGKVLSGLNKRIQRSLNVASISDAGGFEKALNG